MAEALLDVMEKLNRERGDDICVFDARPEGDGAGGEVDSAGWMGGWRGRGVGLGLLLALQQGARRLPMLVPVSRAAHIAEHIDRWDRCDQGLCSVRSFGRFERARMWQLGARW